MGIEGESAPFLAKDDIQTCRAVWEIRSPSKRSSSSARSAMLIVSLANLVLLATSIFLISASQSCQYWPDNNHVKEPYSPANTAIEYEYRTMTLNHSVFLGHPGTLWENAMSSLLEGTLIRVSQDELDSADATSIPLTDGGFAAGLGVAHNLHCVKKLKQFLYFHESYPDIQQGGAQYNHIQEHADHCLDFIRQNVMCHIDFSLYTLVWGPGIDGKPVLDHHLPGVQKCVNWEKVQDWMQSRSSSTDMLTAPKR